VGRGWRSTCGKRVRVKLGETVNRNWEKKYKTSQTTSGRKEAQGGGGQENQHCTTKTKLERPRRGGDKGPPKNARLKVVGKRRTFVSLRKKETFRGG